MFSTKDIFNTNENDSDWSYSRLKSPHIKLYFIGVALYVVYLSVSTFFKKLSRFLTKKLIGKAENYSEEDAISNDFYKAVPLLTLYYEYRKVVKEYRNYNNSFDANIFG